MENTKKTTEYEFLKPPFFKASSLMFPSGHSLVLSDRNYRCSLDCRGACDLHEPQIKRELMERNFSRYAQKFVLPRSDKAFEFADGLMRQLFHGIIDGEDWGEINIKDEYIDTILGAMKMEIKESGKISESDIDELEKTFTDTTSIDSRTLLLTTLICVFKSISEPENEVHLGRDLAGICRRIHLSETGKIQSILLERWGWYVLNYINKNFLEYFGILEVNGVKILNKKDDPILLLDLKEAVKQFDGDNFEEALHGQSVQIFYSLFSMIRGIIEPVMQNRSNSEQMEMMIKGIEKIMSPQFQAMMNILQLGGARIRKKRARKEEKEEEIQQPPAL